VRVTTQQKSAWFALFVLFGINLMNFFDRQIVGALAVPITNEFSLSDTEFGFITTLFTLIYAVVGLPLGRLTDGWIRTRLIALGVTFWSLLTAASGIAWSHASFIAARIGVGIGEASCAPASQSLIGDMFPPHRRARAMAIFMLGLPFGLYAAYKLSGIIADEWGWRAAFFVACAPGLLLAILMLFVKEPPRGQNDTLTDVSEVKGLGAYRAVLSITTLWWIVLSGLLFNFNSYAVNTFQTAFLQRFHEIGLREATNISAISLGLTGAIGLLLGGWLGDRLRLKYANGRLLLAAITMLIAAPCVFFALQQPKGATGMFTLLMGAASAMTFVYYSTVYSAIQDVVPSRLRGTAVSVYFCAMYVLGASFGSTIMGGLSDYFANQAMLGAGAAEMAPLFRSQGLHSAMYIIPALMLLCAGSLFGAARTVTGDMRRLEDRSIAAASAQPASA
jgi:predicted MFS family arabinose efflux permease